MHEFKFALYDVCKVYGTCNYYIFLFQFIYNMSNICSYNITSIQKIKIHLLHVNSQYTILSKYIFINTIIINGLKIY